MNKVEFTVFGDPRAQGSKKVHSRGGKTWTTEGADEEAHRRLMTWRQDVRAAAIEAMDDDLPMEGPVRLSAVFFYPYRKSDLRTTGEVKPRAPEWKATQPDLSKLVRAIEDAMTKIVFLDDGQVASLLVDKRYNRRPRTYVLVERL